LCDNGIDDDDDGRIDCNDADCIETAECALAHQSVICGAPELAPDGLPYTPQAQPGGELDLALYYRSPDLPGPRSDDQVQGLQLAFCYPCELSAREELDMRNSIAEAVGVDFVEIYADNDPDDGDGCELVLGLLVDALPPFENRTLPPTSVHFRIGNVRMQVASVAATCGACLPVASC